MTDLASQAETLRQLHHSTRPLVLPNAWDVASALIVAEAGFPAIATSSRAVASSLGLADDDSMGPDAAFGTVARIAEAVELPVTADLEAGYQLDPDELVRRLLDAGAVGCNLEDTNHHGGGGLKPSADQAQFLKSVRRASRTLGVPIVINARTDVYLRGDSSAHEQFREVVGRGQQYLAAGADCVYPIGMRDPEEIRQFVIEVGGPVNIWLRPDGPSLEALTAMEVARISLAAGLFRLAMAEVERAVGALADQKSGAPWNQE